MKINKINNNCSFGISFNDVPGKTARQSEYEVNEIQCRDRKNGFSWGCCPVPGRDDAFSAKDTSVKPYELELMGVKLYDDDITINVVDKDDEVIQSHLKAIAQRNRTLMEMNK